jgi:hypothetical protein
LYANHYKAFSRRKHISDEIFRLDDKSDFILRLFRRDTTQQLLSAVFDNNHAGMIDAVSNFVAFVNEREPFLLKDVVINERVFQLISDSKHREKALRVVNNFFESACHHDKDPASHAAITRLADSLATMLFGHDQSRAQLWQKVINQSDYGSLRLLNRLTYNIIQQSNHGRQLIAQLLFHPQNGQDRTILDIAIERDNKEAIFTLSDTLEQLEAFSSNREEVAEIIFSDRKGTKNLLQVFLDKEMAALREVSVARFLMLYKDLVRVQPNVAYSRINHFNRHHQQVLFDLPDALFSQYLDVMDEAAKHHGADFSIFEQLVRDSWKTLIEPSNEAKFYRLLNSLDQLADTHPEAVLNLLKVNEREGSVFDWLFEAENKDYFYSILGLTQKIIAKDPRYITETRAMLANVKQQLNDEIVHRQAKEVGAASADDTDKQRQEQKKLQAFLSDVEIAEFEPPVTRRELEVLETQFRAISGQIKREFLHHKFSQDPDIQVAVLELLDLALPSGMPTNLMDRFYALEAKAWVASVAVKKLNNKSFIKGKKSRETIHNALKVLNDLVGDFAQKESSRYEVAREDYDARLSDRFRVVDTYIDWLLTNNPAKKNALKSQLPSGIETVGADKFILLHRGWSLTIKSDSRAGELGETYEGVKQRNLDLRHYQTSLSIAKKYAALTKQPEPFESDLIDGFRYTFDTAQADVQITNKFFKDLARNGWSFSVENDAKEDSEVFYKDFFRDGMAFPQQWGDISFTEFSDDGKAIDTPENRKVLENFLIKNVGSVLARRLIAHYNQNINAPLINAIVSQAGLLNDGLKCSSETSVIHKQLVQTNNNQLYYVVEGDIGVQSPDPDQPFDARLPGKVRLVSKLTQRGFKLIKVGAEDQLTQKLLLTDMPDFNFKEALSSYRPKKHVRFRCDKAGLSRRKRSARSGCERRLKQKAKQLQDLEFDSQLALTDEAAVAALAVMDIQGEAPAIALDTWLKARNLDPHLQTRAHRDYLTLTEERLEQWYADFQESVTDHPPQGSGNTNLPDFLHDVELGAKQFILQFNDRLVLISVDPHNDLPYQIYDKLLFKGSRQYKTFAELNSVFSELYSGRDYHIYNYNPPIDLVNQVNGIVSPWQAQGSVVDGINSDRFKHLFSLNGETIPLDAQLDNGQIQQWLSEGKLHFRPQDFAKFYPELSSKELLFLQNLLSDHDIGLDVDHTDITAGKQESYNQYWHELVDIFKAIPEDKLTTSVLEKQLADHTIERYFSTLDIPTEHKASIIAKAKAGFHHIAKHYGEHARSLLWWIRSAIDAAHGNPSGLLMLGGLEAWQRVGAPAVSEVLMPRLTSMFGENVAGKLLKGMSGAPGAVFALIPIGSGIDKLIHAQNDLERTQGAVELVEGIAYLASSVLLDTGVGIVVDALLMAGFSIVEGELVFQQEEKAYRIVEQHTVWEALARGLGIHIKRFELEVEEAKLEAKISALVESVQKELAKRSQVAGTPIPVTVGVYPDVIDTETKQVSQQEYWELQRKYPDLEGRSGRFWSETHRGHMGYLMMSEDYEEYYKKVDVLRSASVHLDSSEINYRPVQAQAKDNFAPWVNEDNMTYLAFPTKEPKTYCPDARIPVSSKFRVTDWQRAPKCPDQQTEADLKGYAYGGIGFGPHPPLRWYGCDNGRFFWPIFNSRGNVFAITHVDQSKADFLKTPGALPFYPQFADCESIPFSFYMQLIAGFSHRADFKGNAANQELHVSLLSKASLFPAPFYQSTSAPLTLTLSDYKKVSCQVTSIEQSIDMSNANGIGELILDFSGATDVGRNAQLRLHSDASISIGDFSLRADFASAGAVAIKGNPHCINFLHNLPDNIDYVWLPKRSSSPLNEVSFSLNDQQKSPTVYLEGPGTKVTGDGFDLAYAGNQGPAISLLLSRENQEHRPVLSIKFDGQINNCMGISQSRDGAKVNYRIACGASVEDLADVNLTLSDVDTAVISSQYQWGDTSLPVTVVLSNDGTLPQLIIQAGSVDAQELEAIQESIPESFKSLFGLVSVVNEAGAKVDKIFDPLLYFSKHDNSRLTNTGQARLTDAHVSPGAKVDSSHITTSMLEEVKNKAQQTAPSTLQLPVNKHEETDLSRFVSYDKIELALTDDLPHLRLKVFDIDRAYREGNDLCLSMNPQQGGVKFSHDRHVVVIPDYFKLARKPRLWINGVNYQAHKARPNQVHLRACFSSFNQGQRIDKQSLVSACHTIRFLGTPIKDVEISSDELKVNRHTVMLKTLPEDTKIIFSRRGRGGFSIKALQKLRLTESEHQSTPLNRHSNVKARIDETGQSVIDLPDTVSGINFNQVTWVRRADGDTLKLSMLSNGQTRQFLIHVDNLPQAAQHIVLRYQNNHFTLANPHHKADAGKTIVTPWLKVSDSNLQPQTMDKVGAKVAYCVDEKSQVCSVTENRKALFDSQSHFQSSETNISPHCHQVHYTIYAKNASVPIHPGKQTLINYRANGQLQLSSAEDITSMGYSSDGLEITQASGAICKIDATSASQVRLSLKGLDYQINPDYEHLTLRLNQDQKEIDVDRLSALTTAIAIPGELQNIKCQYDYRRKRTNTYIIETKSGDRFVLGNVNRAVKLSFANGASKDLTCPSAPQSLRTDQPPLASSASRLQPFAFLSAPISYLSRQLTGQARKPELPLYAEPLFAEQTEPDSSIIVTPQPASEPPEAVADTRAKAEFFSPDECQASAYQDGQLVACLREKTTTQSILIPADSTTTVPKNCYSHDKGLLRCEGATQHRERRLGVQISPAGELLDHEYNEANMKSSVQLAKVEFADGILTFTDDQGATQSLNMAEVESVALPAVLSKLPKGLSGKFKEEADFTFREDATSCAQQAATHVGMGFLDYLAERGLAQYRETLYRYFSIDVAAKGNVGYLASALSMVACSLYGGGIPSAVAALVVDALACYVASNPDNEWAKDISFALHRLAGLLRAPNQWMRLSIMGGLSLLLHHVASQQFGEEDNKTQWIATLSNWADTLASIVAQQPALQGEYRYNWLPRLSQGLNLGLHLGARNLLNWLYPNDLASYKHPVLSEGEVFYDVLECDDPVEDEEAVSCDVPDNGDEFFYDAIEGEEKIACSASDNARQFRCNPVKRDAETFYDVVDLPVTCPFFDAGKDSLERPECANLQM